MDRRRFLQTTAAAASAGLLASVGDLGFLRKLGRVSAAEARLEPGAVSLHPEIEPLVRLLEDSPRERTLEEVAARIRAGTSYREVLAALLLAGVRTIQPRPVGFKFHAVLVVNSAHLASLAAPDPDRWLPILWAVDNFKASQAADVREGDWTMGPVDEARVPPAHAARRALVEALDAWDEAAADAAITGMARTAGAHEIFEVLCRYGARDFRDIGHKEIYVASAFRTLETIGWHHAEPVLRSLVYGLLDRGGDRENPARADLPADRPYRESLRLAGAIGGAWLDGKPSAEGASEMLRTVRDGSPEDAGRKVVELLERGVAPRSIFDGLLAGAGELLMRAPGIVSLHAVTFTNALRFAWTHCRDEETRKILLLQNAAFLPLFRRGGGGSVRIDEIEPAAPGASGPAAVEEIFAEVSRDRLEASRKMLAYLRQSPDPRPLADAARRLVFLKGRDSHDYKFSSAVLEDYLAVSPGWSERFLASSAFHLKGSGDPDNGLVARIRAAMGG